MNKWLTLGLILILTLCIVACDSHHAPSYTVHFDTKISWFGISDIQIQQGKSISLPDEPARSDYIFIGWALEDNATADDIVEFPYTPTSDTTLYATYEHIDYPQSVYLINIDLNIPGWFGAEYTINIGDSITAPSTPSVDGYIFIGWALEDNATADDIVEFPHTPIGHTTLYAIWQSANI